MSTYELRKIIDILGGKKIFHREPRSQFDFIEISNDGVPKPSLTNLANYLQVSLSQIIHLLPVSERTIQRKNNKYRFDKPVSEKILHIAEVAVKGTEVFEDREKFLKWLNQSNAALGNKSPMSLLDSSYGTNMVLEELGRLEHGVFS